MVVMKFGGTSVADRDAIRRVVSIIQREQRPRVVVVSALAGVTDKLLALTELARAGNSVAALASVDELFARHVETAAVVGDPDGRFALTHQVEASFNQLRRLIEALSILRDVSPRSLDAVVAFGELISSRIVTAALEDAGLRSAWVDARRVVITDTEHTRALPLTEETSARMRQDVAPILAEGRVAVLGGFIGSTLEGNTTTLGRGGSDYSASIVGAYLDAEEIQIWTDVDGMLTADPRIVPSPHLVPQVSYAEAAELAYFGAKVLHPSTIQPAVEKNIPVRILNSRNVASPGTLITDSGPHGDAPIVGIACKRDITVVDIASTRMLMAYGFMLRVFDIFARHQTAVDLVTTSEVSVSVTVDDRRHLPSIVAALSEFAEVVREDGMAIVSVVGDRLRTDPGVFTSIAGALDGIPLRMISQADTRRNVTFVLRQEDLRSAMTRLHDRFFSVQRLGGDEASPRPEAATPRVH